MSSVGLLFHTLRYLKPGQVLTRARTVLLRRWWILRRTRASAFAQGLEFEPVDVLVGLSDVESATTSSMSIPGMVEALERAEGILEGRFRFLSVEVAYESEPRWHDPGVSHLWRYHLHYFNYVIDLLCLDRIRGGCRGFERFRTLALSWIAANGAVRGDGWHPYTVSLRVVNWIHALTGFRDAFDACPSSRDQIVRSLSAQITVLMKTLEFDVRGNHLMENVRALLWATTVFPKRLGASLHGRMMRLLEIEVAEQVLPDGGHFERSPGYHCVVLYDLLEIGFLLRRSGHTPHGWLDAAIGRMWHYLQLIQTPDGRVPLLKDTAWDACLDPLSLLQLGSLYLNLAKLDEEDPISLIPWLFSSRAERKRVGHGVDSSPGFKSVVFPSTGHAVVTDRAKQDYFIYDFGKVCPDYLPAHAHADIFTYEVFLDGIPVVRDSGVYEYTKGPWRDHFRSTRAHNCLTVDGVNQSEVWGSFRVGRRARVQDVCYFQTTDDLVIAASHTGFRRLKPSVSHKRVVWYRRDAFVVVLDFADGMGSSRLESFVHLAPTLSPEPGRARNTWRMGVDGSVWITFPKEANVDLRGGHPDNGDSSWYSERFSQKLERRVFVTHYEGPLPMTLSYAIAKRASVTDLEARVTGGIGWLRCIYQQQEYTLRFSPTFEIQVH